MKDSASKTVQRTRRDASTPSENRRYSSFNADSTGFRLYNAWVNTTPEQSSLRENNKTLKSNILSTVGADENQFLKFGNSMYSDAATIQTIPKPAAGKRPGIVSYNKKDYPGSFRGSKKQPRRIRLNWKRRRQDRKLRKKLDKKAHDKDIQKTNKMCNSLQKPNGGRRQLNKMKVKSSDDSGRRKGIYPAIHLQAKSSTPSESKIIGTTIFTNWEPARWVRRLRMMDSITLKSGKLSVASSGIYYVYAQINYIDDHDANAFQIFLNDSPVFLCTTMTHKRKFSTKANTCYTGGVVLLESGDTLYIKDLEERRSAVMHSVHS